MDLRETLREQLGKTGRMLLGVTGDVTEEEGAARPQGLAPIVWQVGHVTYYDALLVQEVLGGPLEVPEQYGEWFKQGSAATAKPRCQGKGQLQRQNSREKRTAAHTSRRIRSSLSPGSKSAAGISSIVYAPGARRSDARAAATITCAVSAGLLMRMSKANR